MQLNTYLNYGGNCEEAVKFYEQRLGGTITMMTKHGELPNRQEMSWLLSDGGEVCMPMQETFFASRFATLRHPFGTSLWPGRRTQEL